MGCVNPNQSKNDPQLKKDVKAASIPEEIPKNRLNGQPPITASKIKNDPAPPEQQVPPKDPSFIKKEAPSHHSKPHSYVKEEEIIPKVQSHISRGIQAEDIRQPVASAALDQQLRLPLTHFVQPGPDTEQSLKCTVRPIGSKVQSTISEAREQANIQERNLPEVAEDPQIVNEENVVNSTIAINNLRLSGQNFPQATGSNLKAQTYQQIADSKLKYQTYPQINNSKLKAQAYPQITDSKLKKQNYPQTNISKLKVQTYPEATNSKLKAQTYPETSNSKIKEFSNPERTDSKLKVSTYQKAADSKLRVVTEEQEAVNEENVVNLTIPINNFKLSVTVN